MVNAFGATKRLSQERCFRFEAALERTHTQRSRFQGDHMNPKAFFALLVSASLMVACGHTPNVPSSDPVKTQSVDAEGGGSDGGSSAGTLLGSPYPQGRLLATFPRARGAYQTFAMDWLAVGFSYDWYSYPGVELKVCSFDANGAMLSCTQQNASTRYGTSDRFNTRLSCAQRRTQCPSQCTGAIPPWAEGWSTQAQWVPRTVCPSFRGRSLPRPYQDAEPAPFDLERGAPEVPK
ncbi:MAG: hypothetical protein HC933_03280 [Pleurocapsa sp. SU_196_0]|nr:hypothetical protein [Pleurocapsa sp. SU_196_0]